MSCVVVIDDEKSIHQTIGRLLVDVKLESFFSGEEALEQIETLSPDLILLDINLGGMDGYDTALALKKRDHLARVPIVFISVLDGLEAKLKAYGSGGVDYLQKPFTPEEVISKANHLIALKKHADTVQERLNETNRVITDFQRTSTDSQVISRFSLMAMHCHDVDTLIRLFSLTTDELGVSCALKLNDNDEFVEGPGQISQLEREILEMSANFTKIYQFGNNRAIYRWPNVALLVRNLGSHVDSLAMLLDAFDVAFGAIQSADRMLQQASKIQADNHALKKSITQQFRGLEAAFAEVILSLGFAVDLDEDEEDRIRGVLTTYKDSITSQLDVFSQNGHAIEKIISDLRKPSPELNKLLDERENQSEDDDDIFF